VYSVHGLSRIKLANVSSRLGGNWSWVIRWILPYSKGLSELMEKVSVRNFGSYIETWHISNLK
jgi:hypothetical protein